MPKRQAESDVGASSHSGSESFPRFIRSELFFFCETIFFSILGKMVQAPDGGENGENVNAGATESPAQSGTEGKIVPDLEPWA